MKIAQLSICAAMTALLIAVQYSLSFVSGIELVTVLFLCFCHTFGIKCGLFTAWAFSLLRCLLFGFMPNVILLYLIYYSFFAVLFGFVGKKNILSWVCPVLLAVLAWNCSYFAITGLPISVLYQTHISIMLWVIFSISLAILVIYVIFHIAKKGKYVRDLFTVTILAVLCTVMFTLLDDIITPLFMGYSAEVATAYFYTGFIAMIPQTICVMVSVFTLFCPLKRVFRLVEKTIQK